MSLILENTIPGFNEELIRQIESRNMAIDAVMAQMHFDILSLVFIPNIRGYLGQWDGSCHFRYGLLEPKKMDMRKLMNQKGQESIEVLLENMQKVSLQIRAQSLLAIHLGIRTFIKCICQMDPQPPMTDQFLHHIFVLKKKGT